MAKNYKQLTESIRGRLNPENFSLKRAFTEELATISFSDVLTFIRFAMKGVEPEYTQKSKDAGEKVKEHLLNKLTEVTFRYQGSVMTDTHIKGYSDIDLLTISEKFYTYDAYNIKDLLMSQERRAKFSATSLEKLQREAEISNYTGDSLADLMNLRLDSEQILHDIYEVCDTTKPKSIKIKNKSLNRDVDIVIANWYDDVTSIINEKGEYRGIQVYNKDTNSKEKADYPFISIRRINDRSAETNGRLKKMIRFLKNIKAFSEHEINLSSFDINAICYDISKDSYQSLSFYELVPVIYNQLRSISINSEHSDNIISVDGREYIFRNNSAKLQNINALLAEVESIYAEFKSKVRI